jgi:hypothetical protein
MEEILKSNSLHPAGQSVRELKFLIFSGIRKNPNAQMMITLKGLVASMGTYISSGDFWDLVAVEDNVPFMIHNPMGGVAGDYREMQTMFNILEGLTKIIADVYSKKIKKPVSKIREMMDAESWFFGQEIVNIGFADELIKSGAPSAIINKDEIIAMAKLEVKSMKEKSNKPDCFDTEKIAAILKPESEKLQNAQNPAGDARDNNKSEVFKMTLEQFLNENPAARSELDIMLKEQFKAGEKSVQDRISAVSNFIKPDSTYPASIKSLAAKVIDGECDKASLLAAVATYDAMMENKNSEAAADESKENADVTGQQTPQPSADGEIKNELDYDARIKRLQSQKGMEV